MKTGHEVGRSTEEPVVGSAERGGRTMFVPGEAIPAMDTTGMVTPLHERARVGTGGVEIGMVNGGDGAGPDEPRYGRDWPAHTFLGRLDQRLRGALLELGQFVRYASGTTLIIEGDLGRDLFILLDGVCKVTGVTPHGVRALLAVRVGGDLVGEIAAMDGEPRSATVTAGGAVTARRISPVDMEQFLVSHPMMAAEMNRAMAAKLRWSTRRRVDYGDHVKIRLARVLVELAYLHGTPVADGTSIGVLTQPEIGGLIGAGEPSAHKALAELRSAGILSTRYRRIVVHDLSRLGDVADGDS